MKLPPLKFGPGYSEMIQGRLENSGHTGEINAPVCFYSMLFKPIYYFFSKVHPQRRLQVPPDPDWGSLR